MSSALHQEALANGYRLWTPPSGRHVEVGPQHLKVPLPATPFPVHREDLAGGDPSDDALGRGVYDYLRQFPDCPHNTVYAELLRDAYPQYLADLGAQAAMLDHKEVDAPYVMRKITYLRILALLEPENSALLQQIGISLYDLGTNFSELSRCRKHLLSALGYLQRALKHAPDNLVSLNYCGQIDFFLGDYPSAGRHWSRVLERLEDGASREALASKLVRIDSGHVPDHPLIDDLEAVGGALVACGEGDFDTGKSILEQLEEEGTLPREIPMPEFFYLLGVSRARSGDEGGAFEAFEKATQIDPDYQPAIEGREAILDGRTP
jgi:tetratricopeptide (TPR) repeat protein